MRTSLTLSLAIAALAVLPGCSDDVAPKTAAVAERTDTQPSEQDRAWMRTIHQGNLAEVEAGRLAQGKGTTKQIKSLGQMLVKDHTKLDTQVTRTAQQLGVQLPTSMNVDQRDELIRLQNVTGQDFDQDFLAGMAKAHRQALAATKKEISGGTSQAVKALAAAAVPSLRKHMKAVHEAQGATGTPSG
ncbi:DUF4142 domain-containing protein [Nonomuraea insulae]|uniref:DUF4142 domain-containing protein n=1 Tax=Nonomuraea insulae TaxID=1616787 RepID=A0ABW1CZE6_9ACTN